RASPTSRSSAARAETRGEGARDGDIPSPLDMPRVTLDADAVCPKSPVPRAVNGAFRANSGGSGRERHRGARVELLHVARLPRAGGPTADDPLVDEEERQHDRADADLEHPRPVLPR